MAMAASTAMIATAMPMLGSVKRSLKIAREASTAYASGLAAAIARSQSGANDSGSSTPESSSSGSDAEKISGAYESSLPSHSATAYETGVIMRPSSASSASISTMPSGWMLRPKGSESRM